jgi:FlaA1/EpsC-like NDP-sugar epimerase
MKSYSLKDLSKKIKADNKPVVLYGAGTVGKLAPYALNHLNVKVDYFCDSSREKQGRIYRGLNTISSEELPSLGQDAHIFIANDYLVFVRRL